MGCCWRQMLVDMLGDIIKRLQKRSSSIYSNFKAKANKVNNHQINTKCTANDFMYFLPLCFLYSTSYIRNSKEKVQNKKYVKQIKEISFTIVNDSLILIVTCNCEQEKTINPIITEDKYLTEQTAAEAKDINQSTVVCKEVSKVVKEEDELKNTLPTPNLVIDEIEEIKNTVATIVVIDNKLVKNVNDDAKLEEKFCKTEKNSKSGEDEDESNSQLHDQLFSQRHFRIKPQSYEVRMTLVKSHPSNIGDIPWIWLKEERWRLHTYSQYPHSAKKSAILLAQDGFAYIGSGKGSDDSVICYFCCATKKDWLASDIISEIHRILSPDCCMVTGENCANIPMTVIPSGNALFSQLNNFTELISNVNNEHQSGQITCVDEIESDSAHDSHQAAGRHNLSLPPVEGGKNAVTAQTAEPFQMANQTVFRSNASNSSAFEDATGSTATQRQRVRHPASHNSVASNSNQLNQRSSSVTPNVTQSAVGHQESRNIAASVNISLVTSPAQTSGQISNGPQATAQAAAPSQAATSPQTNQVGQNTSTSIAASSQVNQSNQSASTYDSSEINQTSQNPSASTATADTTTTNQTTNPSQENSSQAGTGNTQTVKNPTYGELGIITERPKRFEYAVRATRYASFDPWPRDHHLTKEDLADAGFYYAGYGDCARCFYCGGGLRNWEDDDNVWVEHARWFPKCAYIRQTMGQQFVNVVQDLNKDHDKITFQLVMQKMGSSAASFHLDTKNMPLKRDPAVMTVIDYGYDEKDVIEAANFVKENNGMLSADKLFERLMQLNKPRASKEASADISQVTKHKFDTEKDKTTLKKLKEENSQLRQQTACKICMDKEVAVVFLPCGHFVSCTDCAAAMKDCPVCRKQVRGIVRAFIG